VYFILAFFGIPHVKATHKVQVLAPTLSPNLS
jgi:hypothetical protein